MRNSPILARKRIDDASSLADSVYEQMVREEEENRRAYERFYNNLALFSGGTIALSVTYLGYLQSRPVPVSNHWLIAATWAVLLICVASALFRNVFHTKYLHYARQREYNEKKKAQYETELKELPKVLVVNPSDLPAHREKLNQAIDALDDGAAWCLRREKVYSFLDTWSSRLAETSFIVGLIFLFSFAVQQP